MIEMMLAVAIVGTAMLATVSAFSTAAKTSKFVQETTTAEWIAISQIELIRVAAFQVAPGVYASVSAPAGYSVSNATSAVIGGDANIQIVTVTVDRGTDQIYVTSALKVNR
jgi:type II secretory pathway pseudopilin PulG